MEICYACEVDAQEILLHDKWIKKHDLLKKLPLNEVYIARVDGEFAGWMRYGLYLDCIPYLTMLNLLPAYQKKGYGTKMMDHWEDDMGKKGYPIVMTSTAQDETAQHFYIKLGYKAVGSLLLDSFALELLFTKRLSDKPLLDNE